MSKKQWWEEELESAERDSGSQGRDWLADDFSHYNYDKGYSASSYMNKYGDLWSKKTDDHEKCSTALREVARSVNIIRQRCGYGADKRLEVKWSDGTETNNPLSERIVLSPDIISQAKTAKPNWKPEQLNDALIGEGLMLSGMKKTLSKKAVTAFMQYPPSTSKHVMERVWFASETDGSRRAVCGEYRGLAPYFKANIEYRTTDTFKSQLEGVIQNEGTPCSATASNLWAWNLLHPDEPVIVPKEYTDAINMLNKRFGAATNSDERYATSMKAATELLKMFGEKDKMDKPDSNGNMPPTPPSGTGDMPVPGMSPVTNNVDPNLGKDKVDVGEEENGISPDTTIRKHFRHVKMHQQQVSKHDYTNIITGVRGQIAQLKHKLRFRSVKKTKFETGCRSGEIDEATLHKLGVDKNDDYLFMRREAVGAPHVAFTILVDESGSMNHERIIQARQLCAVLVEAMADVEGVHLAVLGHTSHNEVEVIHYFTPENYNNRNCISHMSARGGTDEGGAIHSAVSKAVEWFRPLNVEKNIVLSISDGGTNVQECLEQVQKAKKHGVLVYGCGVCNAYNKAQGKQMYGDGRFIITKDVASAINPLGSFISRVALEGA
jgi:hypothetical protein